MIRQGSKEGSKEGSKQGSKEESKEGPDFLVDKDGNKESGSKDRRAAKAADFKPVDLKAAVFKRVETWIFDLDNTLYPHHLNLWQQVDVRIRNYIVDFLKVTHEEAFRLQKDYYRRYGTTLRGLMEEHGLDPDSFLEIVHQIDHSPLTPNPALGAAIAALPGRKFILTNGTRGHADAVMRRIGIEQHFDDVFDIRAAELEPKPHRGVYERFLARHQVDARRAIIFEDLARNLEVPHALGMTTVLVVPQGAQVVLREEWELAGRDSAHVDHVTDDLTAFLRAIIAL